MKKKAAKRSSPRKPARAAKAAPKQRGARTAAKKPKASAAAQRPAPVPGLGKEIGRVVAFFRIPVVAVVKVTGPLRVGDRLWIRGHTTNLKLTVDSLQINHQPITEASKGDEVGLKLSARARRGDRVHQWTT